jgi:hypothetical protein
MRLIAFILAAFVAGGPAAAQNWQELRATACENRTIFPCV